MTRAFGSFWQTHWRAFAAAGLDPKMCPPLSAVMVIEGMSRAFVMEEVLGISFAHPRRGPLWNDC